MSSKPLFDKRQTKILRKAFNLRARKESGKLSQEKMKSTIRSLRLIPAPSDEEIDQMCRYNEVTFEDFITTIYMYMRAVPSSDELIRAFQFFDPSKTGRIPFDTAVQIIQSQGMLLSTVQKEAMRAHLQPNDQDMVDYVAFAKKVRPQ
jgi:Ca2+-binding EF-hand superfamily protein